MNIFKKIDPEKNVFQKAFAIRMIHRHIFKFRFRIDKTFLLFGTKTNFSELKKK